MSDQLNKQNYPHEHIRYIYILHFKIVLHEIWDAQMMNRKLILNVESKILDLLKRDCVSSIYLSVWMVNFPNKNNWIGATEHMNVKEMCDGSNPREEVKQR